MPHTTVYYTDNIAEEVRIPQLLEAINTVLLAQNGLFPEGAIRSRAIALHDYRVGNGSGDRAFMHITLFIMPGRPAETVTRIQKQLYSAIMGHLSDLTNRRHLGLTLEITEMNPERTERYNNFEMNI